MNLINKMRRKFESRYFREDAIEHIKDVIGDNSFCINETLWHHKCSGQLEIYFTVTLFKGKELICQVECPSLRAATEKAIADYEGRTWLDNPEAAT